MSGIVGDDVRNMLMLVGRLIVLLFLVVPTAYTQIGSGTVSWEPKAGFDNQLYPSFILTTATIKLPQINDPTILGGGLSLVGIEIISPSDNASLRITIQLSGITDLTTYDTVLPRRGQKYIVVPPINFKYDILTNLRQPSIVNGFFSLQVDGVFVGQKVLPISVRSVNDVPLWFIQSNGQLMDMPFMLAGYVTEDHPWIDQLLREALNTGTISRFVGTQGNTQEVFMQVAAIWNALQRKGFRYSNIPTTSSHSRLVGSQYVRFLSDSVLTSQANCLDGSVLFASILRKIGIDPLIVLTRNPDHAFLGFNLNSNGSQKAYLETTWIGNTNLSLYRDERTRNQISYASFVAASAQGNATFNSNVRNFNQNLVGYRVVDISQLRKSGFRPIGW